MSAAKSPKDATFPKSARLLTRRDFDIAFDEGTRVSNQLFHLHVRKNADAGSRLGLVVSRKYGNAVKRNRFKRLVREAFRLNKETFAGYDLIILPRGPDIDAIERDIRQLLLSLFALGKEKLERKQGKLA